MNKQYNKLVRDRIPEIIWEKGETPVVRTLPDDEFARALAEKLAEEAQEVRAAGGNRVELAKELGDVLEVVDALIACHGLDRGAIERVKSRRREERGGFTKKLLLESVSE